MKTKYAFGKTGVITVMLILLMIFSCTGERYSREAGRIIEETGVPGGLIVHLGCEDGKLTAALLVSDRYVVHGLAKDDESLQKARDHIQKQGLYGVVTVDRWDGERLPYTDNLVNLFIAEDTGKLSMDEVMRVLCPDGIAYIRENGQWQKTRKPKPENTDDWTHFLHGPSNNAVAQDTKIAPSSYLQWSCKPLFARSHELIPSIAALVSAQGKIFYIIDEAPLGVKDPRILSRWTLIARDAYNGIVLWKRSVTGNTSVEYRASLNRSDWTGYKGIPPEPGSGDVPVVSTGCLVAAGDRVFVTLGKNSDVSVLDASTGKVIRELPGTRRTKKILYNRGILVLHRKSGQAGSGDIVQGVDPASGDILWKTVDHRVNSNSLASQGNRVFFNDARGIAAIDLKNGQKLWYNQLKESKGIMPGNSGTLVAAGGTVLFRKNNNLVALSAEDGQLLWERSDVRGSEQHLFVIRGMVWTGLPEFLNRSGEENIPLSPSRAPFDHIWRAGGGNVGLEPLIRNTEVKMEGYDLKTGRTEKTIRIRNLISPGHHYRCYPAKATSRYLLWNKRGVEFMDLTGDDHMRFDWLRGMCWLGFMPANGMIYMPPHQCFCYPAAKVNGFNALAPQVDPERWTSESESHPLQKGPAYGLTLKETVSSRDQWPVYRHDARRSGSISGVVPEGLSVKWETTLGGKLTQPVVAGGRMYISQINSHRVFCLDAQTGNVEWSFTAGGRVDSPPACYRGLLIFGSADGWVYCLDAADGRLVWRFRGAPQDRLIISEGKPESVWPVHGSVLIKDGVVYFAAGRSSHLDGGMYLYGLDPETGEILYENHVETPHPKIPEEHGRPFDVEGMRSGVLVSEGDYIYLRRERFTKTLEQQKIKNNTELGDRHVGLHLFSNTSLLDDSHWDRGYWMYSSRWPGYYFAVRAPKSGSILVFNDSLTFANKHYDRESDHSPLHVSGQGNLLYADRNDTEPILVGEEGAPEPVQWLPAPSESLANDEFCSYHHPAVNYEKGPGLSRPQPPLWARRMSIRTRAMVLADTLLFLAGPADAIYPDDPLATFEGRNGAYMHVVSTSGEKLATYKLDVPPVFDGLIAAENKLFMSTLDGRVQCFGE